MAKEKKAKVEEEPVTLNGRELAAELGVDREHITAWAKANILPRNAHFQGATDRRFHVEKMAGWINTLGLSGFTYTKKSKG